MLFLLITRPLLLVYYICVAWLSFFFFFLFFLRNTPKSSLAFMRFFGFLLPITHNLHFYMSLSFCWGHLPLPPPRTTGTSISSRAYWEEKGVERRPRKSVSESATQSHSDIRRAPGVGRSSGGSSPDFLLFWGRSRLTPSPTSRPRTSSF